MFYNAGHLTLERRHLLGQLGLEGLRQTGEQTGGQLLLHLLFVLHLQGAAEEADTRITLRPGSCFSDSITNKASFKSESESEVQPHGHMRAGLVPDSGSVTPA